MNKFYSKEVGFDANASFALKATQKDVPFKLTFTLLIGITFMAGSMIRMFEM